MQIKDRNSDEFRAQLTQLIEIEFDGRRPPSTVFEALRYYLENTDTEFCAKPDAYLTIDLDVDWQDIIDGVMIAQEAIIAQDQTTLKFAIDASRSRLEVIYRRYGAEPNFALDTELIKHSRALERVLLQDNAATQIKHLERWLRNSQQLYERLTEKQNTSWYNDAVVRRKTSSK